MKFKYLLLLLLIYKFSLDYIYLEFIQPVYAYLGFVNEADLVSHMLSIIGTVIFGVFYKKLLEMNKPSSFIILVFYLLYFMPNLTFSNFNGERAYMIFSILYTIMISYAYIKMPKVKVVQILPKAQSLILFYVLLYGVIILMVLFSVYYNGFNIKFDFEDVYAIRAKVQSLDLPPIINYLKPIAAMFVTIGLMFYLLKKNILFSTVFLFFGLMLYSFGAHKTDLFLIIFTFLIFFFYKDAFKKYLLISIICLNLFLIILTASVSSDFQAEMGGFYIRTFFTPPLLGYYHYDYFGSRELLYMKEHFIHWFDSSAVHTKNSPYIIAEHYFGDPEMSSNTGLIGNDFAQFGWASLIIFPLLRGYFFNFFDAICNDLNPKLLIISAIMFGTQFINGSFFTSLISGGFLITSLLLYLMPRSKAILKKT